MTAFRAFRCSSCGGMVREKAAKGRTTEYRPGVRLAVPDTFRIPTCAGCGEQYLTVEEAERLAAAQEPLFVEWQRQHCSDVVESIKQRHGATLREIERACGVTATYLSHVLAGRKEASITLIRLLEAYSRAPSEYVRQRDGEPWQSITFGAPLGIVAHAARPFAARAPKSYAPAEDDPLLPPSGAGAAA